MENLINIKMWKRAFGTTAECGICGDHVHTLGLGHHIYPDSTDKITEHLTRKHNIHTVRMDNHILRAKKNVETQFAIKGDRIYNDRIFVKPS